MKNFNPKDADQYERKAKRMIKNISFPKSIGRRKLIFASFILGGAWLAYSKHQLQKHKKQRYIDTFQWRKKIANQIKYEDFWMKLSTFSIGQPNFATKRYEQLINQKFTQEILVEYFRTGEDIPKKQFILSQHIQYKVDIGFLRLHSFQSRVLIDPNNNIAKRSLKIPITLFGVPIRAKQKQSVKKTGKKVNIHKFLANKTRFQLASECKNINKFTKYLHSSKQRKEILHECKQTMGKVQQKILKDFADTAKIYIEAQKDYDQEQEEARKSIQFEDDIFG